MFKMPSKKTIILIILAVAAIGLIVLLDFLTSRQDLSKQFKELNDLNLNFSFEDLDISEAPWTSLVPDDLANVPGSPQITVNTNILSDEEFNIKAPFVNLEPPVVGNSNVFKPIAAECGQFQSVSSCSKISSSQDRAICEQCQKGKK